MGPAVAFVAKPGQKRPYLRVTRLIPAIALMAALFLPPGPTAADTRFARLAQPGIVAIVRHAHAPGTGDSTKLRRDDTISMIDEILISPKR